MFEIAPPVFLNAFIYLSIPFVFGFVFKKFNLSPIVGYIVAGIVVGNFFSNLISREIINNFAFFGIILLLFTIGLEINFEKILILKKFIITGGFLQVVLSIFFLSILSLFFGFNFVQSLLIGIALASSSTALVAKIIQDRGEESSFMGELALGILMFQDLAFIPFIIIFTFFHSQAPSVIEVVKNIAIGVVEASLLLFIMYYFGKKWIPLLFNRIAKASREILNLFIVLFIFFVGYLSSLFHVPILIGMFMAGVLVSQTLEHYHIFSQIRPFRDILAIIFFVYIGTHIQIPAIVSFIPQIIIFSLAIMFIKAIILLGIFIYFKFSSRLAFVLAIFLFQVSENAFILLTLAYTNGIFTSHEYLVVITAVLVSIVVTPFMINKKDSLYMMIRSFLKKYIPSIETFIQHKIDSDRSPIDVLTISNHIIICGYGRIGSHIGRALMLANIPFIAIDYNFHIVSKAQREGIPIIYGDPSDLDILDYAQAERAMVLVAVIPDRATQEALILNTKKINPHMLIISRVHRSEHRQRMKDLGAHVIVQPEIEASISIIKRLLLLKRIPKEEIARKIRYFKVEQGVI